MADARRTTRSRSSWSRPSGCWRASRSTWWWCPGAEGDFGVLPQHSLLMSLLRPGVIEIYQGAQVSERIFVGGGFAEVNERGCTVLAEEAKPVEEIDLEPGAPAASRTPQDDLAGGDRRRRARAPGARDRDRRGPDPGRRRLSRPAYGRRTIRPPRPKPLIMHSKRLAGDRLTTSRTRSEARSGLPRRRSKRVAAERKSRLRRIQCAQSSGCDDPYAGQSKSALALGSSPCQRARKRQLPSVHT